MPSEIQAVLFDRNYWDITHARQELNKMGFKPIKEVHITDKFLRYRIKNPENYERLRNRKTNKHIEFVIGFY